ncbi:hypothetical protein GCM10027280_08310 [Micromonospora polyrhachis]|uniref:Secreted protein n=1 Tax=Micromonospora polyrhachis TaxID=1282883 RepID=A0A7W7WPJ5_9ACTN|nr:hypothetical protein [Micromonospora polyrhachis]MBB4958308.1 hypothetical protein [Micromonospora polyrhachis]
MSAKQIRSGLDLGSLRLALVLGGLVLALLAGFAIGRIDTGAAPAAGGSVGGTADDGHLHPPGTAPHEHAGNGTTGSAADSAVGGLSLSAGGFTLVPSTTSYPVGRQQDLRFQVRRADRTAVTDFAVVHEKPMHLIVVRRDLSGFQHLHPSMAPDGTWSIPLTLPEAGIWRAYADFTARDDAGRETASTLGVDLVAAGDYAPRPLPVAVREATVDGFTVTYEGTPQVDATQPLLFRVFQDGSPVGGIERYLGAYGHLVALRQGDLGYVHVHPEEQLVGGAVKFWLSVPSPGSYRLFFDFQVAGVVRTAEFTLTVP